MHKTLIIKENQAEIVMKIRVKAHVIKTREIARFSKCGMGYVALGAAGRAIIKGVGFIDELIFDGHQDTYDMLVSLDVVEPIAA